MSNLEKSQQQKDTINREVEEEEEEVQFPEEIPNEKEDDEEVSIKSIHGPEKRHKDIDTSANFATPLVGQFLNLDLFPVEVHCPACGQTILSEVEKELCPESKAFNKITRFFYLLFCCCCCFDYKLLSRKYDKHHYCRNCGCYFGRYIKYFKRKSLKE